MTSWNKLGALRIAFFCAVCLSLASIAPADERRGTEEIVEGVVSDQDGEGIGKVYVRFWGPSGLSKKGTYTREDGSYRLFVNAMQVDAVLFDHQDYHIQVQGYVQARRGKPISPKLYSVNQRWPNDISPALRFCHIANEYEEAAVLTLMTDSFNRRFIMFEFEQRGVIDRLRKLPVPADSRQQQQQQVRGRAHAEADFLAEKKGRLLETFRGLQGLNERR